MSPVKVTIACEGEEGENILNSLFKENVGEEVGPEVNQRMT